MSAPGLPVLFLGLCLLLGAEAQGGRVNTDLSIRPNLPSRCYEPPNTSRCGGTVTFQWYYDLFTDSCKVFPHRGCPNVNSFPTRKECMDRCIKSTVDLTNKTEEDGAEQKYRSPEGKSAKPRSYRFTGESLQSNDAQEGNSFDTNIQDGEKQDGSSRSTAEQVLHDVGMMLHGRDTEQVTFVHNPQRKVQNHVHHRRARSYQPYEEHRLYNLYHDHMDQMGRIVTNNQHVQFVPQPHPNTFQQNKPRSRSQKQRQRRLFGALLKMDGVRGRFKTVERNYDGKRFNQRDRQQSEDEVQIERPQFWPAVDNYNEHEMDNLEITNLNYDETRHQLPERQRYVESRQHGRRIYEPEEDRRREHIESRDHVQHQVHRPRRRKLVKDRERKNGFYYHYESPDHPPRSPKDEYYYGRHRDRPSNIPPNMYIYGEGPVHPVEVPKELQEYDPNENNEEVYPVDKEFDSPQDGRQEKKPFVNQRGFAPEPFRGAFPGIPKDPALRRFRLRSGWVIEIIAGGFRAIKDERSENGWRHVYARIYREAPDGSAGRSIWMFQSEYEPPEDDHSPPPEYLQHVTNNNNQHRQRRRHKRHASLMSHQSQHWFTSLLSSFSTSGSSANSDELDEIYGEPRIGVNRVRIPFVKNVDPETVEPPHQEAVEGRSLYGSHNNPNYRPRNGPPMRQGPMNPSINNNNNQYGHNVGFPPRNSHGAPHGNSNPMNREGGFDMYRRPQKNQYNVNNNMQPPRAPMRPAPQVQHYKEEPKDQKPKPDSDFMRDEDIFDKVSSPQKTPKKTQPTPEKPPVSPSDFMSDTEIFEGLPKITIPTLKTVEAKKAQGVEKPKETREEEKDQPTEKRDGPEGYPESGGVFVDPEDAPVCMQFPETGPCKAYIRRWYYDPRKAECFTFIYGGCEGNKNSFQTKEECMKTCTTSGKEEESQEDEEESKPPQTNRRYFGLRRQGRKNSLPVVMTSTPTEAKPIVMTTPHDVEPEAKMAKLDKEEEEKDDQSESSEEEEKEEQVEENEEDSSSESSEEEQEQVEGKMVDEQENPTDRVPVVNHYYTYHNYGPRHATHGTVRTSSEVTGKEDASSSSSDSSSSEEEDKKEVKNKVVKKQKKKGRLPSPINIFFRFLKRLRPRKPKVIIRTNGQERTSKDKKRVGAKATGVTFVKLFFTKKGRKNNMDDGDRVSPLSSLASFRLPHRSSPFSDMFSEPEPRRASYMESPMHQNPQPYNNGPFHSVDYHQQSNSYNQPPPPRPMSSRFNSNPPMYPMDNLMWQSPSTDFIPPWSPLFYQQPLPPVAPPGEKNLACGKPVDEGLCFDQMSVPRWFYDQKRGVCDVFYYTGCGGNENRFESYKQCHDVCMVKSPAPPTVSLPNEEAGPKEAEKSEPKLEKEPEVVQPEVEEEEVTVKVPEVQDGKQEAEKEKVVEELPVVHSAPAVVHTFEFANMHLDNRMEYVLVVVIMILGGAALIVLVAITAYFMYKKHKLATRAAKDANIQKVFRAHAYPEVHKISVIELPRELPGVHDNLKLAN